jgi:quercetin dioxygenase-like cupin family protein
MDYARIVRPAEGVQVIDDITDQPGKDTIEGEIGPLLWGEISQSYFVDVPAGAFLDEHPHPFEALIYAVKGSFVVCSEGTRYLVEEGGFMSFAADVPTGYEVPFDESAFMLVFRGQKPELDQIAFMDRLEVDSPTLLHDLPEDHPARVFARQVNPSFG